ncbi:SGNH/GDSL hydrolase family protein [Actinomadura sp. 6N118]|uniref:SGNH/GDSL hydrolase family protein n=1 Tax=Actinomadura sp. 6N118 TaxID=3375151 RepID=UPI0037AE89CB
MTGHVLADGIVRVEGAVDVERRSLTVEQGDGFVRPWRLPVDDLALHHPDLVGMAAGPCGVRLCFRTAATRLAVDVEPVPPPDCDPTLMVWYDLVVDGELYTTHAGGLERESLEFEGLPDGTKDIELWLPHVPGVRIGAVHGLDGAIEPPGPDERPRWIVYGSSITHGLEATPSCTWPAVAARLLGRHLTNLGYAGQCHLDPLVARMIAELPADHITLKVGINIHNKASLRERTFAPLVHGFLATLRDHRPDIPITVVSPIISPERETTAHTRADRPDGVFEAEGDLTLQMIRDLLAEAVALRRARGDRSLAYLDGRELLGKDDAGRLPDGLHPDALGLRLMGERYAALAGDRK